MRRTSAGLVLVVLLWVACGDSTGSNDNAQCEEGFRPEGPACVPIFDDCPGPAEIPVLGGGCQPVGVTECATGFESDGEGGCEPILPSEPCPPGTMEMIGHTECQPVGVIDCGDGFVSDGEGGCDAILPDGPCPWGYMEILGETECQPIGDCGTGTWGVIEVDATTVFVDASADATGADGSQGTPFTTIQDAYDVVVPGGQIAVAAGEYEERLVIDKEVRLTGRCAELVTIRGGWWLGEPRAPMTIGAGGSGTTVQDVSLTGDAEGLRIVDAAGLAIARTQIVDAGSYGLYSENADISLTRIVVASNHYFGIALEGTVADLSSVVVRDTQPRQSDARFGYGLQGGCDTDADVCGVLRLDRALLIGNHHKGIGLYGIDAELSSVVVKDTFPQQSDDTFGVGLEAGCISEAGVCGRLRLENSLLTGNHHIGVALWGTDAEISSIVIRDTLPQQSDGTIGTGLQATCDTLSGICGSLRLNSAHVRANHRTGIYLKGIVAEISSVVVRDTLPRPSDNTYGLGISAGCDPDTASCGRLQLNRAMIQSNRTTGIALVGTEADISSVVIRGTLPQMNDDWGGYGIAAECDSETKVCGVLRLDNAVLEGNHTMSMRLMGCEAEIHSVVVRDTQPEQSALMGGYGIGSLCHVSTSTCVNLRLDQAVIQFNRMAAIALGGTEADITSVVVRDTLPQQSEDAGGLALQAGCDPYTSICGSLVMTGSLLQRSQTIGILTAGVPTTLSGVAVVDTLQNEDGPYAGAHGTGISSSCYPDSEWCAALNMTDCLVDSSYTAGISVQAVVGSIQGSVVRHVAPRTLDDAYGYGIQVEGVPGAPPTVFHVSNSLVQDAELAGILYYLAGGTVSGSQITGGQYTVVMNQGANPVIQDDNDLSGSLESEPTWSNMEPAPAPEPILPWE
ncbi:hypothetical protein ACFL51_01860 [Myxococcota bacterium]